jgi:hypothetical protein
VTVNAGQGSTGFSINENGLVWAKKNGFGGWLGECTQVFLFEHCWLTSSILACEWYHNGPQLFWINGDYSYTVPCSCSKVNLEPIYSA